MPNGQQTPSMSSKSSGFSGCSSTNRTVANGPAHATEIRRRD
jgi:hypothetical protein